MTFISELYIYTQFSEKLLFINSLLKKSEIDIFLFSNIQDYYVQDRKDIFIISSNFFLCTITCPFSFLFQTFLSYIFESLRLKINTATDLIC